MRLELVILKNLVYNKDYSTKVIPYIKNTYFTEQSEKIVFSLIYSFIHKYKNLPSIDAVRIGLDNCKISQEVLSVSSKVIDYIEENKLSIDDTEWITNETEKWAKDKSIYLALMKSVSIIDESKDTTKKKGRLSPDIIPQILTDALSVSFDPHIGHNYLDDWEERYNFYTDKSTYKIPFHLKKFNEATNGGIENKTLNVIMAGPGVGKTMLLCDMAAHYVSIGKKVLYITLEISELNISKRIDANLLHLDIDAMADIPKDVFKQKLEKLKCGGGFGTFIVKEYPTSMGNVNLYRALLNDLKLKKGFIPDIIINDYVNINSSIRYADSDSSGGTYSTVKAICEELRGLGVEQNVPIWSATQTTRSDFDSSSVSMKSVAESWGLPQTCDFLTAFTKTAELEQLHQIQVTNLKTRYGNIDKHRKFLVGYDTRYMRFYELDNQDINTKPTYTQTKTDKNPLLDTKQTKKKTEEPDAYDAFFGMKHNEPVAKNMDFK